MEVLLGVCLFLFGLDAVEILSVCHHYSQTLGDEVDSMLLKG